MVSTEMRETPMQSSNPRRSSESFADEEGAPREHIHGGRICGLTRTKCALILGAVIGITVGITMAAVLKPSGASLGSDEKAKADGASNNPNGESYYTESGNSFGYLSYGDIVLRLRQLQEQYPKLLEVYTTQQRFNLRSAGECEVAGQKQPCYVYVMRLGNQAKISASTPEVFLSGELHGNERIGPTATVEFATLLLNMYKSDAWARRLLDTRVITVVPTANAIGYYSNTREELGIDPNRDFAWDQSASQCMQTVAAQSINELWKANLFQLSATFHGGDHMISYPWGDNIHCCTPDKYTSADNTGMAALTEVMRDFVGKFDSDGNYQIGPLNKIIYPVAGGMEDWAYAASWDPTGQGNVNCNGAYGYGPGKTAYNNATHRAINLLVETAFAKTPRSSTLGKEKTVLHGGGGHSGDGHIPRNVRLCWILADMVQPWVHITNLDTIPTHATVGTEVEVLWEAGGAVVVNEARVECLKHGAAPGSPSVCTATPTFNHKVWMGGKRAGPIATKLVLDGAGLANGDVIEIRVHVRVDEAFGSSSRAEVAKGLPQSHFVRARTDPSYMASNNGQSVRGQVWWETEEATLHVTGRRSRVTLSPRASPAPAPAP